MLPIGSVAEISQSIDGKESARFSTIAARKIRNFNYAIARLSRTVRVSKFNSMASLPRDG